MELAAVDPLREADHDPLSAVLAQLGERVAPITLARERTIPVVDELADIFPDGGIVRGRVLSCQGPAASTAALVTVGAAMRAGAWLAVVDVSTFGADAAAELGVPLERVVRVDTAVSEAVGAGDVSPETQAADWIDVMGAATDGFDLVVTRVPAALRGERRPAAVRKLTSRITQRGAVVVVLGDPGVLSCDVALTTVGVVWEGLGQGNGHLRRRHIEVEASGRRQPGVRRCGLELVGTASRVELRSVPVGGSIGGSIGVPEFGSGGASGAGGDDFDPQAQVLAEMRSEMAGGAAADCDAGPNLVGRVSEHDGVEHLAAG